MGGSSIEGEDKEDTENLGNRENQWFANKVHLKCINNKCPFLILKEEVPREVMIGEQYLYAYQTKLFINIPNIIIWNSR